MRVFSLLVCFLMSGNLFAQDSLTMDMIVPKSAVKFSPLHLINFYPTIEVSYEHKIARQTTLQAEVGYVLDFSTDSRADFQDKRGVKLKLEGRYYFFGRTDRHKLYYLGFEGYTNIINFDRQTSQRECFDLNCDHTFVRNYAYKMEYREKGATIKVGWMKFYSRFFFDFSSGWTVRDIIYKEPSDILLAPDDDWNFLDIPNETTRTVLSPYMGLRMGLRLR